MWQVQILIGDTWKAVRPAGGEPYRFASLKDAERAAKSHARGQFSWGQTKVTEISTEDLSNVGNSCV